MAFVKRGASFGSNRTGRLGRAFVVLAMVCSLFVVAPPAALAAPFTVSFEFGASDTAAESGAHMLTVKLSTGGDTITDAIEVSVTDAGSGNAGPGDYSFSTASITFPAGSDDTTPAQSVSVSIVDDSDHEDDETIDLQLNLVSAGADGATLGAITTHTVTIVDDDPVSVSFSNGTSATAESGTHTITVELNVPGGGSPASPVTVDIVDDASGSATSPADYTLATPSVTFGTGAADGATRDVDLTIVPDAIDEDDETVDLSLSLNSGPATVSGTHEVTINDNDTVGVTVSESSVTVTEGGVTQQYSVVLDSEPAGSVSIDVSNDTGEATVTPGTTNFNSANWDTPKFFTVEAFDDGLIDGSTADTMSHTATSAGDADYDGIPIDDVAVTVNDDDVAGVTVSKTNLSMTEGDAGDSYTIVLDSQPAGNVTITPSDSDGEVVISPPSLTFGVDDWDIPQNFTVTAPNNSLADGNRNDTVSHMATSGADPDYNGVPVAAVAVAITDDEGPAVASIDDVSETETDGTVVYTFTISIAPASGNATTVRVDTERAGVNPADPSEYEPFADPGFLVNIPAQAESITVDIDAYGDELDEGGLAAPGERFQVVLSNPTGGLTLGDATGRGTIIDDDYSPIAVPDSYNIAEGGTLVTTVGNGVLVNDTDADDGQGGLTASEESDPANHVGGFTLDSNGGFTYTHDGSAGTSDSFTYLATDGTNESAVTTVTINIDNVAPGVNAGDPPAPVAEGDDVFVNATFTDPGLDDVHTATINWGDGTVENCPSDCTITFNTGDGTGTVSGSHPYGATGVYTVTVTVDDGEDTGFDTLSVTVQNADFTVDDVGTQSIDEGGRVDIDIDFDDADGSGNHMAVIIWGDGSADHDCPGLCTIVDNGDGTGTVTGGHQYRDNGSYSISVRVFDPSGDEGFGGGTADVANVVPIAGITAPTSADEGDVIELTGTRVDPGDDTFDWSWQVTRDGEFYTTSDKKNPDVLVTDDGEYEFTLVVTDDDGGVSDPATHTVTVDNVAPVAEITDTDGNIFPGSSNGGEEGAKLKLRSSIDEPGADELTYAWAIRLPAVSGATVLASSDTKRINYTPVEDGAYFVTLTVDDDDGGSSFRSVVINIDNALPVIERIAFDATPAVGADVDMDVFWSDAGSEDTHTVTVDWGEGPDASKSGSSPRTFSKTYSSAGTRTAEVCVEDDDGGESCELFYVNPGATFAVDSDFNGDGFEDLAIGVPGEDSKAGAVNVLYGSASGIKAAGDDIWKQGKDGIAGSKEAGDRFGSTLAWGDFNLDGYSDLAVAATKEGVAGEAEVGTVHVIYGSASGLTAVGDTTFHQDTFGVAGGNQPGDRFGSALAVGDFNGDGFADLAIGVPFEDTDGVANTGRVGILFGSPTGLTSTGDESWDQDAPGIKGVNSAGDRFGETLAAGDFNLDGFWDLAIGSPHKAVSGHDQAGSLLVIGGSILGLDSGADSKWDQDTGTMGNSAETRDRFAATLAAGDFNGDGRPDLAVGIPDEGVSGKSRAGAVAVMLSGSSGLSDSGNQVWHENVGGIRGLAEAKDRFGFALAAGDFNNDGRDDLAIGVPNQDVDGEKNAGDVALLLGGANGLKTGGDQRWNENTSGIKGKSKKRDHLGRALRALDQDGDGDHDLAIGIPDQNKGGHSNAGAVLVLRGRTGPVTAAGDSYWHQDTKGVREATGKGDKFGKAL